MSGDVAVALWCLRNAFKQLRYKIRDGAPLLSWSSDVHGDDGSRHYTAYKNVLALVGSLVENQSKPRRWYRILFSLGGQTPTTKVEKRARMLIVKAITSHRPPEFVSGAEAWVVIAERLSLPWNEEDGAA